MALKAEVRLSNYVEVSPKCKREDGKKKVADPLPRVCAAIQQSGTSAGPAEKGLAGVSSEESGGSWQQEYLMAESSRDGHLVCMVCGGILSASGPAAARKHILQHHAHSLDFNLEEKRNILEGWSEGVVLPEERPLPCPAGLPSSPQLPDGSKEPAEIEVLLDSEEQLASQKRGRLPARCEAVRLDPKRRQQGQRRPHSSARAKEMRSKQPSTDTGREWPSECGVPGSAPAEIRIFTDGSFPAGFALKLYCRTQPEPPQASSAKPETKKRTIDRDCSVSLLRLHHTDPSCHLGLSRDSAPSPLSNSFRRSSVKDCGAKRDQQGPSAGKDNAALVAKSFNPAWRARFLMDFDAVTGRLVCMVCEYPLRRTCLTAVKQHILQCHAETLHLPREVRRTIREVWETRGQSPAQAPRK